MQDRGWLRTSPIAHRGLHDDQLPENSMPAFEAALAAGYGIELDVHVSRDGRLIVMHDEDVTRMTGQDGMIAAMRTDELTRLRLGNTDLTVPTLDAVLHMVDGRVPVLVEVKTGSPMERLGPAMLSSLKDYRGPMAVQSFDPRVLMWLKRHLPDVLRGQLSGSFDSIPVPASQKVFLRSMVLNAVTMPHFIVFEVDAMPSVFVAAWRRILRAPVLLWTVCTDDQLGRAAGFGANVIFEDIRP